MPKNLQHLPQRGSQQRREKVAAFSDEELKKAWIAQLESYEEQNKIYDTETNAQDWTALMEAEARHRKIDLSQLESPDGEC